MADHLEKTRSHVSSLLSPKVRAYFYGVMCVLAPVGVYYGITTVEEAGLWIAVAGVILGVSNGLALANVPGVTKAKEQDAGTGTRSTT